MRGVLGVVALVTLAGSSQAATEPESAESQCAQPRRPAKEVLAELATQTGMRTLVYSEHSDGVSGGPSQIGIGVIAQPKGTTLLVKYDSERSAEIMQTIACEEGLGPSDRWKVSMIADGGDVAVERGPSPGSIDGFLARLREAANRAFPGHTAYPHAAEAAE